MGKISLTFSSLNWSLQGWWLSNVLWLVNDRRQPLQFSVGTAVETWSDDLESLDCGDGETDMGFGLWIADRLESDADDEKLDCEVWCNLKGEKTPVEVTLNWCCSLSCLILLLTAVEPVKVCWQTRQWDSGRPRSLCDGTGCWDACNKYDFKKIMW